MRLKCAVALCVLAGSGDALAGEVKGRVIARGAPVAGVSVAALAYESPFDAARREAQRGEPARPLATGMTSADGSFTLALAPTTGAVRLRLTGGGIVPTLASDVLDGAAGDDAGDLRVDARPMALAGRVVDSRGGPVVGAGVTLWAGHEPGNTALPVTTNTSADGSFRLEGASQTGNRLRIEMSVLGASELRDVRGGALRNPITLQAGRSVAGAVLLPDRKTPAADAVVRLEARGLTTRWTLARKDGSFTLDGLPPGEARIVADAGDLGHGQAAIAESGRTTVTLVAPGRLAGRVADSRSGASLAGVRLVARGSEGAPLLARSGADGRFTLAGLIPGAYTVEADEPHHVAWERGRVRVVAGETAPLDVLLRPASSLSGRVTDEAGAPVEGAQLSLASGDPASFRNLIRRGGPRGRGRGGPQATARSARDGSFTLARVLPGSNFSLVSRHEAYPPRTLGGLTLPPGAAARAVTVVMHRGPVLAGRVQDEAGRPLAGVEVELSRALNFQGGRGGMAVQFMLQGGPDAQPRRTTGNDGRFEFRDASAGSYALTASKPGYARLRQEPVKLEEAKPQEPLELTLSVGAAIRGFVRDRSGIGVSGWNIMVRPSGSSQRPQPPQETDGDGAFVIDGLIPGAAYDLQALGGGGLGPSKPAVTAPAEDVELKVSGKGRITGRVSDADSGRPVADFTVSHTEPMAGGGGRMMIRLGPGRRGQSGDAVAVHSDDGSFALEDVDAGTWDVEVQADGYQRARLAGVPVDEGGTASGIDVKLSRGGVIAGRVTDVTSGKPVLDAAVHAELSGGERMPRFGELETGSSAQTDGDGHYELSGLQAGTYVVSVTHPDYADGSLQVALRETAATGDVKLGRGSVLAGSVVGSGGGPVAGAAVTHEAAGVAFRGPFGAGTAGAISDGSGRFRFERMTPGRYTLQAALGSTSSAQVEVVLQQGLSREDVVLSMATGATLRGRVTGLPDAQRGGVNVRASGSDGYFGVTTTTADGSFELGGVPIGPVALRASVGDFTAMRSASAQVVIEEAQVEAYAEIAFAAGLHVSGHVSSGGAPVAGAMVSAFPERQGLSAATTRSDDSGGYVLDGLQEGSYSFHASPPNGGADAQKQVTLTGDTTVDLEVPQGHISGSVVEAGTRLPLADATLQIEESAGAGGGPRFGMKIATTDVSGRFALDGLEPRTQRLLARKAAYEAETRDVDAAAGEDIVIELKRGEGIGLQARDGIYGTPLRTLRVRVLDASGAAVFMGDVPLDADGRGEVPSLRPGTYELRIDAGGYAPRVLPGVTAPASGLALALTPGGTLDIQVGPETLARPNPSARLLNANGGPYLWSIFTSDGVLGLGQPVRRLSNVAPGSYSLVVDGGGTRRVDISEGGITSVTLP